MSSVRTEVLMGTVVTIEVVRPDAGTAIERALDWFRHVEATCSRFDPQSELFQLTARIGEAVPVSTMLFEAIRFAVHVADATAGAFDPTIGSVMQQRGFNREHRSGTEPPRIKTDDTPAYRDVVVDDERRTVMLRRPLLLDLGAVAKGLAVDLAARELQPLEDFAIDAGGDLYLGGLNRERAPWAVGIRHPQHAGGMIASVSLSNRAICTSGDYERGDHILDPREARRARLQAGERRARLPRAPEREARRRQPGIGKTRSVASVSVIAASAMLADALSTAAFVLGPEAGLRLLEAMTVDGLIVGRDLTVATTPGWPRE
ncbi:MAG TPA: FAD:protein FMN transferase [Vicinamibacterales bacterium]|nr:FAD:protein FMN transferase [Vicinamibacterales bacterium]